MPGQAYEHEKDLATVDTKGNIYALEMALTPSLTWSWEKENAATAFFPNEESFIVATIFVALTAPFVCFPSICLWAIFGSSIKSIIKNSKVKKIIEYLLAILLVVTAVIVVID